MKRDSIIETLNWKYCMGHILKKYIDWTLNLQSIPLIHM